MSYSHLADLFSEHDGVEKSTMMGTPCLRYRGNVIYLLTQRAGQSGVLIDDYGSSDQSSVTLSGNVYRCLE